jgi:hypothetical protein
MALGKQLLMTQATRNLLPGGCENRKILTGRSYRKEICSVIGKWVATSLKLWRLLREPKSITTLWAAKERQIKLSP